MERDSERAVAVEPEPGRDDPTSALRSPQLRVAVYQLLQRQDLDEERLEAELGRLCEVHGEAVYSALIHLLSHLDFEPAQATGHWQRITEHRRSLQRRLGSTVDLRVALVDYFLQVDRKLESPKIIEMRLYEQTRESAYRDELTGLHNYRFFRERLDSELARSRRYGTPLSLLMIDVDDFKAYNDRNGHDAGSDALAALAGLVTEATREEDFVTRYGGEELAVLLPFTPKSGARLAGERVRTKVEEHRFVHGSLTVSIGVATCPADGDAARPLIRRADQALYAAKAAGKNRCRLYGDSSLSYCRREVALRGELRMLASEAHPLTVSQISEAGALLCADHDPGAGSLVEIQVRLPGEEQRIPIGGRVVSVTQTGDGRFEVELRTVEIASADRARLSSYLRETAELPAAGVTV